MTPPTYPLLGPRAAERTGPRLAAARFALAVALALLGVLALASRAPALEQRISVEGDDLLGFSVAVRGDTLVLGAPYEADHAGAVYVYRRDGDSWTRTAKLTASDGEAGDFLGGSVAIDGDTIVAGAPDANVGDHLDQGAAYTFARTGEPERTQTAKLTVADGAAGAFFGSSVAIDGDTIVAGAPYDEIGDRPAQGSVYTFARTGSRARAETARLIASDGAASDHLGTSVAIQGDTIVAGAPNETSDMNTNAGAAYTFARDGATPRTESAKLTASVRAAQALLGLSVAIDGDTIVAGAPGQTVGALAKGAAYTFARTGEGARTQTATLTASDGVQDDAMGWSVAIDGDTIVAGAPGADGTAGAAYTFDRVGAVKRRQTGRLADADGEAMDYLGYSVSVDGETIVAGAPFRGSASVFFAPTPPPPPPPPPTGTGTSATSQGKPALSKLAVKPKTIHRAAAASSAAAKRARITFTLSAAASVELRFQKAEAGRAVGRTCAKPSRSNRGRAHCIRYVTVGRFTVQGKAGANAVPFTGRRSARSLFPVGRYRLVATPTGASGDKGAARTTTLRIVRR